MRKLTLAILTIIGLLAPIGAAIAQPPPPVPALPDTERRVQYLITAVTGPFAIPFQIYGDGTDYSNWIEVWFNGTLLTGVTDWQLTLTSGNVATAARPITNAQITLTIARTGTLQIVGARRPRRASQFGTSAAPRDLNVALTDIVAQNRETWDKLNDTTGRAFLAPPGETLTVLPPAASRASLLPCFDAGGQLGLCAPLVTGLPVVAGQGICVTGSTLSTCPGIDTNVLNAQTSNYTLQTSDCGKTVTLAGGFITLTVGAASGFPATCSVVIQNIGGTRGKKMAINGVTFPNGNILWPLQSFTLKNLSNTWFPLFVQNRWKLAATTAFFVDGTNGLDTNDGLSAGAGGAFQTIQKSIDTIVSNLDLNEQAVTVDVAVGNYPENLWLGNYPGQKSQFGFGQVLIRATNATCANTKINPTAGSGIFATGGNPPYTFQGFQFESPGNSVYSVQMDSGGFVALKAVCFGATAAGHLLAQFGGSRIAMVASTFNVVGGGTIFMDAQHGSDIYYQPGSNVTLTGTPLYAIWARAKDVGRILTNQATYTGSADAATQRYSVENNGTIDTGDNTSLPGGVDGKVYAGGVYNGLLSESKQGIANHPVDTNIGTPVLSSCGAVPAFSGPATDAGGRIVTGAGAAACTLTFTQAWPNSGVPTCIVTAIDKASALVYTEGNTTLVLSTASASAGYRYQCSIGQ